MIKNRIFVKKHDLFLCCFENCGLQSADSALQCTETTQTQLLPKFGTVSVIFVIFVPKFSTVSVIFVIFVPKFSIFVANF